MLKYPNSKNEKPGSSRYWDPYSYKRNDWYHQESLFRIPEMSSQGEPGSDATPEQRERYYTSSDTEIYIDNRNGNLIRASFSVPAFNMAAASRSDTEITYDKMHELVKKYLNVPAVKFYVNEPAVLLDLNEENWEEWLLTYIYSDKPAKTEAKKQDAVKAVENSEAKSAAAPGPVTKKISAENSAYIRKSDFRGREELKSMLVPQSVKIIEEYAFSKCVNLRRIKLPDGLLSLGAYAFKECKSLENITLPGGIKIIRSHAFAECSNLKSVELCEGIVSIGESAFEQCAALATIILPGSLKKIQGFYTYEDDYDGHGRYIRTVNENPAFSGCQNIKKVYFRGTREQWDQIDMGIGNDSLRNAEIIYEYK